MSDQQDPVKTVAGIPIYLDGERFTASFGRTSVTRSRLREVEAAISAWASQRPTLALTISEKVPVTRSYDGSFASGFSAITVTGHRDGRFRRGEKARDVVHGQLYVHSAEMLATLTNISQRCQEALLGFQREWEEARGKAERLTPEHLADPRANPQ